VAVEDALKDGVELGGRRGQLQAVRRGDADVLRARSKRDATISRRPSRSVASEATSDGSSERAISSIASRVTGRHTSRESSGGLSASRESIEVTD